MGIPCISGGLTGYLRTRSIPSIAAGCTVGALYLWSAYNISQGLPKGHQGAFGTSTRFRLQVTNQADAFPSFSYPTFGCGIEYVRIYDVSMDNSRLCHPFPL